ncbi:Mannose-binding lectin [Plasmopara halstedii]|uniref:Mannose-binding lectin n=1 Tax=Plasmopara halstedii TaxID=4781 RepID=A0A0P1AXZ5_PLAHL|nr:Mannose-binding lectin [Plasmopara halstedii]CEG47316.1 Mannose-binding lectin [Plasmopara halstedii]|eukprot:XP_024583685.1 Mannose-binding lectin [Plasmopara halstedii]
MKIYFSFLAVLAVAEGYSKPDGFEICGVVGGPHGKAFDDTPLIQHGQKVTSVTICQGHRLDGLGINFNPPDGMSQDPFHGSKKNCMTHNLASDEYITHWEAQTVKADDKTKISYIRLMNNKGVYYEGGKETKDETKKQGCDAPEDFQLGGFQGRSGQEIDAVGPIWVSRYPLKPTEPDKPALPYQPAQPYQPAPVKSAQPYLPYQYDQTKQTVQTVQSAPNLGVIQST